MAAMAGPALRPLAQEDFGDDCYGCMREQLTLSLWVPFEQVGLIIGKKGAMVNHIQRDSRTQITVPPQSKPSAWAPITVKGSGLGAFAAYQMLKALVEELDECVMDFPFPRSRLSAIIGTGGGTIRRLSADHAVRILVPNREAAGRGHVELEGEVDDVFRCLREIMVVAFGKASSGPDGLLDVGGAHRPAFVAAGGGGGGGGAKARGAEESKKGGGHAAPQASQKADKESGKKGPVPDPIDTAPKVTRKVAAPASKVAVIAKRPVGRSFIRRLGQYTRTVIHIPRLPKSAAPGNNKKRKKSGGGAAKANGAAAAPAEAAEALEDEVKAENDGVVDGAAADEGAEADAEAAETADAAGGGAAEEAPKVDAAAGGAADEDADGDKENAGTAEDENAAVEGAGGADKDDGDDDDAAEDANEEAEEEKGAEGEAEGDDEEDEDEDDDDDEDEDEDDEDFADAMDYAEDIESMATPRAGDAESQAEKPEDTAAEETPAEDPEVIVTIKGTEENVAKAVAALERVLAGEKYNHVLKSVAPNEPPKKSKQQKKSKKGKGKTQDGSGGGGAGGGGEGKKKSKSKSRSNRKKGKGDAANGGGGKAAGKAPKPKAQAKPQQGSAS